MKKLLFLIPILTGCTTFSVVQKDISPDEREITTQVKAAAWFTSAQTLANLKASQSDKTQALGTTDLKQHGATNVAESLKALVELLRALQ